MITILGKSSIPQKEESEARVKITVLREILNGLEPGRATVVEVEDRHQGRQLQMMLHTAAELAFGQRGMIHTRRAEQLVYVWLDAGFMPDSETPMNAREFMRSQLTQPVDQEA